MKKYRIEKILHSGRKGIRFEPVIESKYDGLIGSIVEIEDLYSVEEFQTLHMIIKNHPQYDWWDTTEVLGLAYDSFKKEYFCETINTIYVFKEIDE